MAEFLIRAKNNTNPDPVKNEEGCYKRGDLVVAFPDGHTWGRMESKQQWLSEGNTGTWPGTFVIIKIPDLTLAKAKSYIKAKISGGERRSLFRAVWADIPSGVKQTLASEGEFTASLSQVKNFIRSKLDESTI